MIRNIREAKHEEGFTLIELLVVVIIIGILAAIAIPAFLNQRERAWQAELTSAVRNTALEIEAEATALGGAYPATVAGQTAVDAFQAANVNRDLDANGTIAPGEPITMTYASTAATGFTLCGETTLITSTHRVQYLGGALGNGIQAFDETAGC